ncbi:MAG: beta-lactamase family protein [Prosthecobacter sp.]|uniref:serine hydrolase domain-containing protein n=1 Tax=Prosthecobacter sp. TaxID=1965333 RepID=UPI0025F4980D|nr:serine hydrolase [Prosthecobacter sp.]MCF7786174.1 beta-lactamase family protein [Prosthecobacter sp.]
MPPSRRSFLRTASLAPFSLWIPRVFAEETALQLARSTPEAQGVSAKGILDFIDAIEREKIELHSFMMLRHGKVIAEGWWKPYGPEFVHTMYSMSKSFTSTAVGFAVAEGKLSVEDKVVSFFADDLPATISENLAAMRVKDLLTMSTGNEKEPTGTVVKEENWARTFLAQNFAHKPGTQFMYNSVATYMCSAIVQRVTHQTVLDYLTPRLFAPLGIKDMKWETCPHGINTGGWGLSIQTEGLAKFGQFLLQKGQWNGKQLLPAAWVEEATRFHIQQPGEDKKDRPKAQNDWLQGYGYQFWRCQGTAFRGDGAFGQFTIVLPEQDAVIVMTSENKNMQGQLDLVWKHLLPAMDAKEPQAADLSRLKTLILAPQQGSKTSPAATSRKFKLEANGLGLTTAAFVFDGNACVFTADYHTVTCGLESWKRCEAAFPGTPPRLISGGKPKQPAPSKIAASAAWTDDNTLVMQWRYYETPHSDTVTCQFDGDNVTISFLNSITAMNPKAKDVRMPLKGQASV